MVILAAIAWIACAVVAYSTHTLGTLLIWSIPIPVLMVSLLISMRLLYLDRAHAFTLQRQRRSPAKEQRKAVPHERTAENVKRLDAAA
jgi:hypothetical protein